MSARTDLCGGYQATGIPTATKYMPTQPSSTFSKLVMRDNLSGDDRKSLIHATPGDLEPPMNVYNAKPKVVPAPIPVFHQESIL